MTPERSRAWAAVDAKVVRWHEATAAVAACVDAHEVVEHMRPVVDLARAVAHANSGAARGRALVALVHAVAKLEGGGR